VRKKKSEGLTGRGKENVGLTGYKWVMCILYACLIISGPPSGLS
jgi:hypothetical protein